MGVVEAVHLPAEHDDRVRHSEPDQTLGQALEVVVVLTLRAGAEQLGDRAVGDVGLVACQHGHVQDEQPIGSRLAPPCPAGQEIGCPLDVRPGVAGEVGVPGAHLGTAEPAREVLHLLDAGRVVVEIGAHCDLALDLSA